MGAPGASTSVRLRVVVPVQSSAIRTAVYYSSTNGLSLLFMDGTLETYEDVHLVTASGTVDGAFEGRVFQRSHTG